MSSRPFKKKRNISSPSGGSAHAKALKRPDTVLIYGLHSVKAALENPQRKCLKLYLTKDQSQIFPPSVLSTIDVEQIDKDFLQKAVGDSVAHQGVALLARPLPALSLEDILDANSTQKTDFIIALDQVTDPQNVGAIARSARAFGATALIYPKHNAADPQNGALIKTACGAAETLPLVEVNNFSQALKSMQKRGYWCIGLDEGGDKPLPDLELPEKTVLVMGAEGKGLRELTRKTCDMITLLPTDPSFPTLNVSAAASVALYEISRRFKEFSF